MSITAATKTKRITAYSGENAHVELFLEGRPDGTVELWTEGVIRGRREPTRLETRIADDAEDAISYADDLQYAAMAWLDVMDDTAGEFQIPQTIPQTFPSGNRRLAAACANKMRIGVFLGGTTGSLKEFASSVMDTGEPYAGDPLGFGEAVEAALFSDFAIAAE